MCLLLSWIQHRLERPTVSKLSCLLLLSPIQHRLERPTVSKLSCVLLFSRIQHNLERPTVSRLSCLNTAVTDTTQIRTSYGVQSVLGDHCCHGYNTLERPTVSRLSCLLLLSRIQHRLERPTVSRLSGVTPAVTDTTQIRISYGVQTVLWYSCCHGYNTD